MSWRVTTSSSVAVFLPQSGNILIRVLGPSLVGAGLTNVLANPTLELRDDNGQLLIGNNDWQDNPAQAAAI